MDGLGVNTVGAVSTTNPTNKPKTINKFFMLFILKVYIDHFLLLKYHHYFPIQVFPLIGTTTS